MIDLRTASRSAARVARHRRAAPASELALVVLYTQAAIVGGLFQACPTDSISHCRFQCYRPLDNTLIIYIDGDNGSSPEGTTVGTPYDWTAYNGILDVPVADQLKFYDGWG